MNKTNLVALATETKLAPNSKAAKLLKAGKVNEVELAKALLTTSAYKTNSVLKSVVDTVLNPEATKKVVKAEEKPATRNEGEPRKR